MKMFNKLKKGQALPLNTIVIAILVIIVLLVIIVFFTTRVGETGDQLNENSASVCSESNPAIATVYPGKTIDNGGLQSGTEEPSGGYKKVIGVADCWVQTSNTIADSNP